MRERGPPTPPDTLVYSSCGVPPSCADCGRLPGGPVLILLVDNGLDANHSQKGHQDRERAQRLFTDQRECA